ncbi:HPF/RaiA family ribosome-associated protein [Rubellimicrobium sp. CFH 75288]|uniref:HPF/RaiA family ribosome-associated protein n=1 Tax=Rubellimicrobium sp. CFH 75288 TaxID=2697034 RepID=UPI0014132D1E|nr:HPF/RaiA family ribosome-associated protein [Rubellimicrobium sp. CFH 75288]NAZ37481.1 ribosomal subunit interface protein [Rubellimicrobium sp. CFH 75288]
MHIQVNTGDNVTVDAGTAARIEQAVRSAIGRFEREITRVEVHLSDDTAARSTDGDIRCAMEARPTGRDPVGVTHNAGDVEGAAAGAARKMARKLDTILGRRSDVKGGATIRGGGA